MEIISYDVSRVDKDKSIFTIIAFSRIKNTFVVLEHYQSIFSGDLSEKNNFVKDTLDIFISKYKPSRILKDI